MNPYSVLGVARDADADTIKKAFRKLAKEHHPDRNEGSAEAERTFKEINRAFEVLSDPKKRAEFDQFGPRSLEPGFDPAAHAWQARGGAPRGGFSGGGDFGVEDLLSQLFGGGRGMGAQPGFQGFGGGDLRAELAVDFRTAASGGERELRFGDGRTLTVRIPPGIRDGETLRLGGQGQPGPRGGAAGDLLLTVHVVPHPVFRRENEDRPVDLPVTGGEALRGATVEVPTLDGPVRMRIPAGTQTDRKLRLRGKGIARRNQAPGDLYARIVVVVPEGARSGALDEALRAIEGAYGSPVRDGLLRSAAA